jgi:H+/gluconate symporter-like permease
MHRRVLFRPGSSTQQTFQFIQQQEFVMAKGSGSSMKIIGIILLVVGAGLALWGYQLSGSVGSQITQAVTGADTDKVMTLYITGAVFFIVGIYLSAKN